MGIRFSDRQQTTIAAAITVLAVAVIVGAVLGLLRLAGWFLQYFSGVLIPLVVALVTALIIKPQYNWLRRVLRLSPVAAMLLVFVSLLLPLAAFFWFFGALLADQLGGLLDRLPEQIAAIRESMARRQPQIIAFWQEHDLGPKLRAFIRERGDFILSGLTSVGQSVISVGQGAFHALLGLAGWLVFPIYLGFFLMVELPRAEQCREWMPFLKKRTQDDVLFLGAEFLKIIIAFFRGQLLVALSQGVLYAIGFILAGLQYGLVLGMTMGVLNLIPYLGSMIGLMITVPLAYFQSGGGLGLVALVLLTITISQLIEAYVLTPRIMGNRTGLPAVAIIFALFFWGTALGGVFGMILAIPLTAFLVVCWRLLKAKYIKGVV